MHFTPILAVAEMSHVSVMDALPYTMGAFLVIVTLAVLWGVCALNAKLVEILIPEPAAPAPKTTQKVPAPASGLPPELVAVVAAAVATTMGRSHRIVSIKRQSTGWEKAGRQSVLTSHKIR